jgi:hypothetical protein
LLVHQSVSNHSSSSSTFFTMEEFNFKEWAKGLPKDVRKTLTEEGYDLLLALTNAAEDDIHNLPLKKGHVVATLAHVRGLQLSTGSGPLTVAATAAVAVSSNKASGSTTLDSLPFPAQQGAGIHTLLQQQQPVVGGDAGGGGVSSATLRADLDPHGVSSDRQAVSQRGAQDRRLHLSE